MLVPRMFKLSPLHSLVASSSVVTSNVLVVPNLKLLTTSTITLAKYSEVVKPQQLYCRDQVIAGKSWHVSIKEYASLNKEVRAEYTQRASDKNKAFRDCVNRSEFGNLKNYQKLARKTISQMERDTFNKQAKQLTQIIDSQWRELDKKIQMSMTHNADNLEDFQSRAISFRGHQIFLKEQFKLTSEQPCEKINAFMRMKEFNEKWRRLTQEIKDEYTMRAERKKLAFMKFLAAKELRNNLGYCKLVRKKIMEMNENELSGNMQELERIIDEEWTTMCQKYHLKDSVRWWKANRPPMTGYHVFLLQKHKKEMEPGMTKLNDQGRRWHDLCPEAKKEYMQQAEKIKLAYHDCMTESVLANIPGYGNFIFLNLKLIHLEGGKKKSKEELENQWKSLSKTKQQKFIEFVEKRSSSLLKIVND